MSVYSDIEYIACLDHNNIVCLFLQRLSVKVYIITTFNRCIDHISFVTINNGILIHVWIWYDVKNRSWRYCNSKTVTRDVFYISATYWDYIKSNAPLKQHQHSQNIQHPCPSNKKLIHSSEEIEVYSNDVSGMMPTKHMFHLSANLQT